MNEKPQVALTIAGSDSSGGAGIQADLKVFSQFDVFGASVLTAITAQNTTGVKSIHQVPVEIIDDQLAMVLQDLEVKAVKIGMIGAPEVAGVIARHLRAFDIKTIIVDTPLYTTTGASLGGAEIGAALKEHLFPIAAVITPNLKEAALLTGEKQATTVEEMSSQAEILYNLGARAVLIKGGHLGDGVADTVDDDHFHKNEEAGPEAVDVFYDGTKLRHFKADFVDVRHTHGTGCALSSAIAALMLKGADLLQAVELAKGWITEALHNSHNMGIGKGAGPVKILKMPHFDQ